VNLYGDHAPWREEQPSCLGVACTVSGPELIVSVEVSRIKSAFGGLSIADVEDLRSAVFRPSPGPFGAGREQRDSVLIVGNDVVQLTAEYAPESSKTRPGW